MTGSHANLVLLFNGRDSLVLLFNGRDSFSTYLSHLHFLEFLSHTDSNWMLGIQTEDSFFLLQDCAEDSP